MSAASTSTIEEEEEWVSPFTAEKVDPRALMKANPKLTWEEARKQVDANFPTKSELRNVIPAHCFERSVWRSLGFTVRDILQTVFVVYVTHSVIGLSTDPPAQGGIWQWLLWRLAWNVYAVVMTYAAGGLWVIAHECGHGAFSPYPWVNGLVGWTLHSALLVPYFSWAFTHAKHHRRTNDLVEGETHVPPTAQENGLDETGQPVSTQQVVTTMLHGPQPKTVFMHYWYAHAKFYDLLGDDGFAIFSIVERICIGFQFYLLGVSSTGKYGADRKPIEKGTFPDHFRPHSRMFPAKMYWKVLASDLGIALNLAAQTYFSFTYGFRAVYFWYLGPYFLINAFLVATTWLQHTDPSVPHFDADNWTWMKGSLAGTIDRPMGFWTNYFSHNISSTHIVHHLFHEIPHYHAVEATKAIREYLEPKGLYNFDPVDMDDALWKVAKTCHFVKSHTDGVQYYQTFASVDKTAKKVQ